MVLNWRDCRVDHIWTGFWTCRGKKVGRVTKMGASPFHRKKGSGPFFLQFSKFTKIFLLCSFVLANEGNAEKIVLTKERLLSSYIERTELAMGGRLTRPTSGVPTNIHLVCLVQQNCDQAELAIKKYVKSEWLSPVQTAHKDANLNLITLVLFTDDELGKQSLGDQLELTFTDKQKVFGEGEEECKVYGILDGFEVVRIVISANINIGEKRLVSCVLSTLARSAGLAFFPSYIEQWKIDGQLSVASEEVFAATMKGTARLLAIHLASFTRPGFTLEQFNSATSSIELPDIVGEQ